MNNFVVILGSSGNGKSSSIKSLDPKETFIINVLNKNLPFKGSKKNYNKDNKNITSTSNWDKISKLLTLISDKYENVKNIVIDDAIYIMRTEFFDRSGERGYDKYNELADHFRKIISKCNSLREDITVFLMLHTEAIETSGDIKTYKASTVGKLLDKMYDPLENTTITLFCQPQFDDATGKPTYGFYTHKIRVDGIEIPARAGFLPQPGQQQEHCLQIRDEDLPLPEQR